MPYLVPPPPGLLLLQAQRSPPCVVSIARRATHHIPTHPPTFFLISDEAPEAGKGNSSNNALIHQPKKGLLPVKDYRGLSFWEWTALHWVYGGGPCVYRAELDIYGPRMKLQGEHSSEIALLELLRLKDVMLARTPNGGVQQASLAFAGAVDFAPGAWLG